MRPWFLVLVPVMAVAEDVIPRLQPLPSMPRAEFTYSEPSNTSRGGIDIDSIELRTDNYRASGSRYEAPEHEPLRFERSQVWGEDPRTVDCGFDADGAEDCVVH